MNIIIQETPIALFELDEVEVTTLSDLYNYSIIKEQVLSSR
ncbi:hypothetical protein [Rummeliibacillus pycnus]